MMFQRGPANPRWNGGAWITSKGYRWVFVGVDHPCNRSGAKGYAPEHLLVFWQTHGRLPRRGFHVHHDDECKTNNAPENLKERRNDTHGRLHLTSDRARKIGRKGGKASALARRREREHRQRLRAERKAERKTKPITGSVSECSHGMTTTRQRSSTGMTRRKHPRAS